MLTYNNWYQWQWRLGGDSPLNVYDSWIFTPKFEQITPMSFKESVQDALIKIKALNKPLYLFYSGGLDSEIILKEAINMDIDIIPVTIRFNDDLNKNDMEYVYKFQERYGIDVVFLDLDLDKWHRDSYYYSYRYLVNKYKFVHYATPLNFWARRKVEEMFGDCVTITGTGDMPLAFLPSKADVLKYQWLVAVAYDSQYKRLQWYGEHYPDDVPLFFVYTPELVKSFMCEPEIKHCVTHNSYKLSVGSSRKALYSRNWPELEVRTKYTGFESFIPDEDYCFTICPTNQASSYCFMDYNEYFRLFRN